MEEDELKQALSLLERDKQRANSLLKGFVERYPNNWKGFLCLAGSESILQNYENAVHYLHIALYLNPDNSNILRNLAYCYRQLGQLSLGTFYYQKTFDLNQWQDPEIAVLLASSLCELGHHQQGYELLKQAQETFQRSPLVNFYSFLASDSSTASSAYSRLTQYTFSEIDYLVSFSMKHDAPFYRELDNKSSLSKLIKTYRKFSQGNHAQDFYPLTFVLPEDLEDLKRHPNQRDYWIVKSSNLSGGQGLKVFNNLSDCQSLPDHNQTIVQKYISNPLLLENRKFNVRAYIVILSLHPFKAFLWQDALIFIAPEIFTLDAEALGSETIHIANLLASGGEIRHSKLEHFPGHLLSLKELFSTDYFDSNQINSIKTGLEQVGAYILNLMRFSCIFDHASALAQSGSYPPKFLGLDIIFDDAFHPWILEVERYPGVGGVFPETKKINNCFKQDYFSLITQPNFDQARHSFLELGYDNP